MRSKVTGCAGSGVQCHKCACCGAGEDHFENNRKSCSWSFVYPYKKKNDAPIVLGHIEETGCAGSWVQCHECTGCAAGEDNFESN